MNNITASMITIRTMVNAPVSKVWETWTRPEHIVKWNNASEDWHSPRSENDLRPGGKFNTRMEAKDGSFGFDFEGTYDEVQEHRLISFTMGDRKVRVEFEPRGEQTEIIESFEPEQENSIDLQRDGWQAILDNFKRYTEGLSA